MVTPPSFVPTSDVCVCVCEHGCGCGWVCCVSVYIVCAYASACGVCVYMHVCDLHARKSLYWHDACKLMVSSVSPFHTCALDSSLTTASTAAEKEDVLSQKVSGELGSFVTCKGGMCL